MLTAPWLHRDGVAAALEVIRAPGRRRAGLSLASTSTRSTRPSRRAPARRCRAGSRSWQALELVRGLGGAEPRRHGHGRGLAARSTMPRSPRSPPRTSRTTGSACSPRKAGRGPAARSAASEESPHGPAVARRVHRPPARGVPRLARRAAASRRWSASSPTSPASRAARRCRSPSSCARTGCSCRPRSSTRRSPATTSTWTIANQWTESDMVLKPDYDTGDRQPLGRRRHAAGDPQRRGPRPASRSRWRRATC